MLFDGAARVVASYQLEFAQIYPEPGWVEHEAEAIWSSQWRAIEGALAQAGCGWEAVAAIGIANQRETVVAWDAETGAAVGNAIVWQDRRTAAFCEGLKAEGREAWLQERTGLLLDPYFSGTKIRWMLENRPEARALAASGRLRLGTVDSWLVWKLSGGGAHVTDVSNASRTQLMDLRRGEWDEECLELFGAPRSALPRIVDSSGELAMTAPEVTGGRSMPVAGIAGDQQAALFGQLCFESGMVKCTYGTGCFMLMQVGEKPVVSQRRLLSTVAWRMGGKIFYALEGSVFMGGAVVQWLRDELGIIERSSDIEALAASVPDSGGVALVPAFTGLGAPYWDARARGTILGLTRGSGRASIARAALEAIACQVADVAEAMAADSGRATAALQADGGASANNLLMQMQADLLGATVRRPRGLETTALGAAFLAGLGVGFWKSAGELAALAVADRSFEPAVGAAERGERIGRWRRAVAVCRSFEG